MQSDEPRPFQQLRACIWRTLASFAETIVIGCGTGSVSSGSLQLLLPSLSLLLKVAGCSIGARYLVLGSRVPLDSEDHRDYPKMP